MSNQMRRWLRTILAALGTVFFVYFAVPFVATQNAYRHSENDLQNVTTIRGEIPHTFSKEVKSQMDEASVRVTEYKEYLARREGYQHLMVENPDMIGWIQIEGTPVDYPVIQTLGELDHYYRRRFDRECPACGMIYVDTVCTIVEKETISFDYILYGHHMKNGSMFASLKQYSSEGYYKKYPFVEFGTENEFGSCEIIGAARLPAAQLNGGFTATPAARTEEDYENLVRYVKERAFYEAGVDTQWPEQLLTLTTCRHIQKDGRLLVVAGKKRE